MFHGVGGLYSCVSSRFSSLLGDFFNSFICKGNDVPFCLYLNPCVLAFLLYKIPWRKYIPKNANPMGSEIQMVDISILQKHSRNSSMIGSLLLRVNQQKFDVWTQSTKDWCMVVECQSKSTPSYKGWALFCYSYSLFS